MASAVDVSEEVLAIVARERVPGSQVLAMDVSELIHDLGMSRLQAKRVALNRIKA